MEAQGAKIRCDAWEAELSETQRWAVYDRALRTRWHEVAAWAQAEFGLAPPSRQGFYNFIARMRPLESQRRLEGVARARAEAARLAGEKTDDQTTIDAYKAIAGDLALGGDADGAAKYTAMALSLADRRMAERELALRAEAQRTRAEQLALARERFQRDTCALFLKWREDERARAVADDPGLDAAAKTEALGRLMFGELWQ